MCKVSHFSSTDYELEFTNLVYIITIYYYMFTSMRGRWGLRGVNRGEKALE